MKRTAFVSLVVVATMAGVLTQRQARAVDIATPLINNRPRPARWLTDISSA